MTKKILALGVWAAVTLVLSSTAGATPVSCAAVSTTKNYMNIDSSVVSGCLGAGVGNLTGNPMNDLFLNSSAGAGYSTASQFDPMSSSNVNPFNISFNQTGKTKMLTSGTFGIDPSFWGAFNVGALGFKFGTGNQPDEWFVFSVVNGVTSGLWDFINVNQKGGGLSHIVLYASSPNQQLPEPSALLLIGVGILGLAGLSQKKG